MPRSYPLVALLILDGWGCAPPGPGNAVEQADTPNFDRLWRTFPHATLNACAAALGPDVAIEHVPEADARASMGAFVDALAVDQQISSAATRRKLGWTPKRDFLGSVAEQWQEFRSGLQKTD